MEMQKFSTPEKRDEIKETPNFTPYSLEPPLPEITVKPVSLHTTQQSSSIGLEGIFPSPELIKQSHQAGIGKTKLTVLKTIMLGLLAGFYVSMGAHCSLRVALALDSTVYDSQGEILYQRKASYGVKTLAIGTIFPMGLMLIVLNGAELFTGNTMAMMPGFLHGDIKLKQILRNWVLVYFSNFSAALCYGWLFVKVPGFFEGSVKTGVASIAEGKINAPFEVNFLKAVGCNWLVNMAIMMGMTCKDIGSKLIALWWPILGFVCMGFEHSIANMFFISSGMMHGADITVGQFLWKNLIPVTLGNIVGGAGLVGIMYTIIYHKPTKFFHKKNQ